MNELEQPQSRRILPLTSAVAFLGFLDTTLLIPIMALYADELGAGVVVIGLIVGLYSITNTPANILFGWLIDRVGYKVPLITGLIGDAVGMFFYSVCRLPIHLGLVRAFHGISGAMVGPATMSVIADYSNEAEKGKGMGFYGMALAAANLVGFGLSGIIVSRLGYKVLFLFGAGLLATGAVLGLLLPGSKQRKGVAAQVSLGQALKKTKGLLGRKGLTVAYGSIFAQYFTFGGVVTLLPVYVKDLGMEAFHVGMLLAAFAIVFMLIQFPSGVISDKVGRLVPIIGGLLVGIVALVLLPSLATFPSLLMAMALYGLAYGILFPSISASITDHTVPEERGLATGLFHALLTAGVAIGAPIMGWVGGVVGIEPGLALSAALMVLALALALIALKRV